MTRKEINFLEEEKPSPQKIYSIHTLFIKDKRLCYFFESKGKQTPFAKLKSNKVKIILFFATKGKENYEAFCK